MASIYKPSGAFNGVAIVGLPAIVAVTSAVFATLYALATWYCPIIYLNLLIVIAWGWATGLVAGWVTKSWHLRSPGLVVLLTLIGALVGYAFSWLVWADLVINSSDSVSLGSGSKAIGIVISSIRPGELIDLARNPQAVKDIITYAYEHGLWSLKGNDVNGPFLLAIWAAEALIYLYFAIKTALNKAKQPYSEINRCWMKEKKLLFVAPLPEDKDAVVAAIKSGDINYLMANRTEPQVEGEGFMIHIFQGDGVENEYICVKMRVAVKKGMETKSVVDYLEVPAPQARQLAAKYDPPIMVPTA